MGLGRVECTQDLTTTSWRQRCYFRKTLESSLGLYLKRMVGNVDNDQQIWIVPEEDGLCTIVGDVGFCARNWKE
ncbi:hypothetical protein KY289_008014 [Solanum tuberosum]|nr:hypothetical protein KY289_008014 [Solanum tuberosum]